MTNSEWDYIVTPHLVNSVVMNPLDVAELLQNERKHPILKTMVSITTNQKVPEGFIAFPIGETNE